MDILQPILDVAAVLVAVLALAYFLWVSFGR